MTSGNPVIVEIDDALSSLRMELARVSTQASHFIYKVPRQLRDVNSKSYEPENVTIGPYHHGKDEFKPMEEAKLRNMQSLLDRKPEVGLERYFSQIAKLEKRARDCYAEPIRFNAAEFIKMLVLDGCFIIALIRYDLKEIQDYRTFPDLQRDLVLLENQIPFFVLCELFDLIQGPEQHGLLMKLVLAICIKVFPGDVLYMPERRSEEVKHILDLIQTNWYPSPYDNTSTATHETSVSSMLIPTATQMKDANVKFKRKEYDKEVEHNKEDDEFDQMFRRSRGTTVFDVEFNQDKGLMSMPTLVITDNTESLLRNFIAYEQFFSVKVPAPFTDYVLLLDCLINSSKDVQILCQHGIIQNFMSSDQDVADIVNRLSEYICHYTDNMMYVDMFNRINTHHKNPWNRAMAVYHRDYFSSPWAYVSFVAAIVLLLLTIAQVVFAALQQFN